MGPDDGSLKAEGWFAVYDYVFSDAGFGEGTIRFGDAVFVEAS